MCCRRFPPVPAGTAKHTIMCLPCSDLGRSMQGNREQGTGNREQGRSFPYLMIWETKRYHGYKLLRRTTPQANGIRSIRATGQRTHENIFKWQFENTFPVPYSLFPVPLSLFPNSSSLIPSPMMTRKKALHGVPWSVFSRYFIMMARKARVSSPSLAMPWLWPPVQYSASPGPSR